MWKPSEKLTKVNRSQRKPKQQVKAVSEIKWISQDMKTHKKKTVRMRDVWERLPWTTNHKWWLLTKPLDHMITCGTSFMLYVVRPTWIHSLIFVFSTLYRVHACMLYHNLLRYIKNLPLIACFKPSSIIYGSIYNLAKSWILPALINLWRSWSSMA